MLCNYNYNQLNYVSVVKMEKMTIRLITAAVISTPFDIGHMSMFPFDG